jgi:RNA polymerase sigma-70 factor (ECF subfamily)
VDADELIRRARAGDQQALGALLDQHRDRLLQVARLGLDPRVQARLDASDVVQQTCLSAFRQIAEFDGRNPAQFAAWLLQVHDRNIQNAVRDQLQTQKRAASHEEHLAGRDVDAPHQITPSRHAMQREDSSRLEDALAQLPADQRAVLRLRYLEDCSLAEVAEQLGLTKDAVVWLMQKGMKRVRQLLDAPISQPP